MTFKRVLLCGAGIILSGFVSPTVSQPAFAMQKEWGKSHHGSHYDKGPRSRPWIIEGIGKTHFPVTSSHPDVQKWFDQGHTLLHGFWYFEAERSFRWCLKLDPDCAMAYWGLARCVQGDESRESRFLRESLKRKTNVSQRERDYIELWTAKYAIKKSKKDEREKAFLEFAKLFDNLLIDYPDDMEARSLYWTEMLQSMFLVYGNRENSMRYAMDQVLQEVLAKDPEHVGALHYVVHNWDGEEGHYALDTCLHLSKVAPKSGHLQHMPGHVLSSIGLWNEAAIAMDSATRIEKEYMQRRMILPENNWDYMHNLDYLCYIQEQLGMQEAALIGAKQMLSAPPSYETVNFLDFANLTMIRLLVKFERWDDILHGEELINKQGFLDDALITYARAQALIGTGQLEKAKEQIKRFDSNVAILGLPKIIGKFMSSYFAGKPADVDAEEDDIIEEFILTRKLELRGRLARAEGDTDKAINLIEQAAELQYKSWANDPPRDPVFLYNLLGEIYLDIDKPEEAVDAFDKSLEKVINDGFALAGLVVAHHQLGNLSGAAEAMGRLNAVWKNADRPNRWLKKAEALGLEPAKISDQLLAERDYLDVVIRKKGHSYWTPPMAPELSAQNAKGEMVTLDDYLGKNVIVIFYLGNQCLHCMEQIQKVSELSKEFGELETEIVAVSIDDISKISSYSTPELGITLLSDPEFSNARHFNSYDDFEEIELHSTLLIDSLGRVHWSRHGGEPFMDFEFLKHEAKRLNSRRSITSIQDSDGESR